MWIYNQQTGDIQRNNDKILARGYSGAPEYKNSKAAQILRNKGPIPRGLYQIGEPIEVANLGIFVLRLTPAKGNEMFSRSQFLIHGDSITNPGSASTGCIILPLDIRKMIAESGDPWLVVI